MAKQGRNSAKLSDLTVSDGVQSVNKSVAHLQNNQVLKSFENELDCNRIKYLNSWAESISQLQCELQTLKKEVRSDFRMELRDAQYYRVRMFQVESKISKLNEIIKKELHMLIREEHELGQDLQATERRVDDWGKSFTSKTCKPIATSISKQEKLSECDPTGDFQKFLSSSGGHYGGWEEQDHLLFLRERRKYGGRLKFIAAVHSVIPDISQEEIEAHEAWYKKYEQLKNLQKEAIKKWRESKSITCEYTGPASEQKENSVENSKTKQATYQRDIAERIKEWKKRQEQQKAEQDERNKREQQNLAQECQKKRELQKKKKMAIEQYKTEKLQRIQNELIASQRVKELHTIENKAKKNFLLKAFREQDMQYIERIRSLRSESATKCREKLIKLENVKPSIEIIVERDRKRLLQPTQVWNQHCVQQEGNADKSAKLVDLQAIPHLAIPSWRKGLSNF